MERFNSNGSNSLPIHQEEDIELLNDMHVKSFTSNNSSDIINLIGEHYKQIRNRAKTIKEIFFHTQEP